MKVCEYRYRSLLRHQSMALAQVAPNVRVTCLDTADVLVVARDLAERMGVESQVVFKPANLLDADFGEN